MTLPLILAAEQDPQVAATDLRALDAAAAEALCDRIAATGRSTRSAHAPWRWSRAAKRRLGSTGLDAERRKLLDLVADGVVQRYS